MPSFIRNSKIFYFLLSTFRRFEFYIKNKIVTNSFEDISNSEIVSLSKSSYPVSLKILWVGADENQDKLGFLDELNCISVYRLFDISIDGIHYNRLYFNNRDIIYSRELNTQRLIDIIKCDLDINLIIGQFWPELIDLNNLILKEIIQSRNIKVICIAMDDFMPGRWLSDSFSTFAGPAGFGNVVDVYATSDLTAINRYNRLGLRATYLPFGCSKSLCLNYSDRDIDISFIGSNYGIRSKIVKKIIDSGININTYGSGFPNGHINSDTIIDIYNRSKIVLGISYVGYQTKETNLKTRDFDVISSGALYITNSCKEFNSFFTPNVDFVHYNDLDDLIVKIKFYLNNDKERERIALSGNSKGLSTYLWRNNLKNVLDCIYD